MSERAPKEAKLADPPDDWSDLSPEELAEVKRAFAEGHEEFPARRVHPGRRGRSPLPPRRVSVSIL